MPTKGGAIIPTKYTRRMDMDMTAALGVVVETPGYIVRLLQLLHGIVLFCVMSVRIHCGAPCIRSSPNVLATPSIAKLKPITNELIASTG